ncbi:PD-(D/E)XK nuclease family protein [Bacillus sp. JJ1566]|uniref:PD-(D/E)XK nuclease family protein n=1 Tax=Bacillus sp. JJ1566 TaxID=3122961 RepID=UPI002FFEBB97
MKNRPNIFQIGTKELTQDAFIVWSLSWINLPGDFPEKQYGLELLNTMLKLHDISVPSNLIDSIKIKRQYKNIDILVSFSAGHKKYQIIIEDKTNTAMHSGQLEKYFNIVKSENRKDDVEIIGIYYKTGYIFDNEVSYINRFNETIGRFRIFNRQEMINVMSTYLEVISSDIFHDYYDHIFELQQEENRHIANIASKDLDKVQSSLESAVGQWIFMKELFGKIANEDDKTSIRRGNSSGRPWTQCSFKPSNTSPEFPEALFYRLDSRQEGFYLSIRQYYNYDSNFSKLNKPLESYRWDKVNRLNKLIKIFQEIMEQFEKENPSYLLVNGKRVTDRAGKKESEIGVFFINGMNTPDKIMRFIPEFHQRFLKEVKGKEKWELV